MKKKHKRFGFVKKRSGLVDALRKYLRSPEGRASTIEFFANIDRENEILNARCMRVHEYLFGVDVNALFKRLMDEHTKEYSEYWYRKGYQPNLTNKMQLLFSTAEIMGEYSDDERLQNHFPTTAWEYCGYYFTITQGQGCFYQIFNHQFEKLFVW